MPLKQQQEHWANGILLLKIFVMTDTYNKQLALMNLRELTQDWKPVLFSLQFLALQQTHFEGYNYNFPLQHQGEDAFCFKTVQTLHFFHVLGVSGRQNCHLSIQHNRKNLPKCSSSVRLQV